MAGDLSKGTKFGISLVVNVIRALVIGGLFALVASAFTDPGSVVPVVVGVSAGLLTFITDWIQDTAGDRASR